MSHSVKFDNDSMVLMDSEMIREDIDDALRGGVLGLSNTDSFRLGDLEYEMLGGLANTEKKSKTRHTTTFG